MKRILILSDVVYADKVGGGAVTDMDDAINLTTGALLVWHENGIVDVTAPDFTDIKEFYVGVGNQTAAEKIIKSQVIKREHANVEKCAYTAAVNERQYIGNDLGTGALNLPGTLVAGTTANVNITVSNNESMDTEYPGFRFEYVVKVGDTNALVLAGVKAQIDAMIALGDPRFPLASVVIVAGNVGLQLNALYGFKFQIGLDGILANATIEKNGASNSLAMKIGSGLPAQVRELELEYSDMRGNANRITLSDKWFTENAMTANINYDLYIITWAAHSDNTHETNRINHQTLIIAVPDILSGTDFDIADFEATLAAAFDLTDPLESGV